MPRSQAIPPFRSRHIPPNSNMNLHSPKGAVLLLNILVIGVVCVIGAAILARGSFEGFLDSSKSLSAWNTRADVLGCIDEALIQIHKDNNFALTSVYTGTATCALTITTPSSGKRSIVATLTEGDITRKVTALVTLSPFAVTQITEP